jgi:hypothetical protein
VVVLEDGKDCVQAAAFSHATSREVKDLSADRQGGRKVLEKKQRKIAAENAETAENGFD